MEVVGAHTLSDFRVKHEEALQGLFVQVLGILSAEGLITLERVMHDGTRIRADASSSQFRRRTWVEECLEQARKTVETLDSLSEEVLTRRKQRARERATREREKRLTSALKELEELKAGKSRVERVSVTDPESRLMRQAEGGTAPSYNVQVSTDAANGLIVGIEPTQAGSDYRQLTPAMERLEEAVQEKPDQVVVDGGYISSENIVAMADRGIELIGPDPKGKPEGNRQKSYRHRGVSPDYESSQFRYVPTTDTYVCPLGKTLSYDAKYPSAGAMHYRYRAAVEDCQACPAKQLCCPRTRHGRSVERIEPLPAITAFRERVQTPEAQAIYRTRSHVAEFPNLWIKEKIGLRRFRVRGLAKVRLECLWAALTYDIQAWIRQLWRPRVLALA
jgi:hypothetical protein